MSPKSQEEWKEWYRQNRREDTLVILDDLRWILGPKRYDEFVGPRQEDAVEAILAANTYMRLGQKAKLLDPNKHQKLADSIGACAIATLIEQDVARRTLLHQMIKESEGCVRTNYQFVRICLRRNLAGLLKASGLDPSEPEFAEMFSAEVLEELKRGRAAQIIKLTKRRLKQAAPIVFEAVKLIQFFTGLAKGEFTHFEEVFPVLTKLAEKGRNFRIGIIVCNDDRFNYIDSRIRKEAPMIVRAKKDFKLLRYYVFPAEYILLVSGEPKQFLIFWGKTKPKESAAVKLANYDWKMDEGKFDMVAAD